MFWVEKYKSHSLIDGLITRINIIHENEKSKEKSRGVEGVTKYLRAILWGHEILEVDFMGSRNI